MNGSIAIGTTFALGSLHALEPRHGSSFIAAFLLGRKFGIRHLLAMAASLLVSHFLLLTTLAFVLQKTIGQEQTALQMERLHWIAPIAIILFGVYLLVRYKRGSAKKDSCNCVKTDVESFDSDHDNSCSVHGSNTNAAISNPKTNSSTIDDVDSSAHFGYGNSALAGLISGIIPCPTALVALGLAGAGDQFSNALIYILFYVLGMATVLTLLGLFVLWARQPLTRFLKRVDANINIQLLSASLIVLVGCIYLGIHIFIPEVMH